MQYFSKFQKKDMLWNPMYFLDTLCGVLHVYWIILGMSNTLLKTTWTLGV
jgi:hypothetical protein